MDTSISSSLMGESQASRRQFLQTLSRGMGGAMLANAMTPWSALGTSRSEQTLGVALVGLGNYATGQLAPALQETQLCKLTGIVTGTPAKAQSWQQRYGLPEENVYDYESYDQIADNEDIDIIYVVLPNAMHAEYTIRAAEAGKHVICEKPMATSVEDGRAMIEACDRNDCKLSIGYRLHFTPHHQRIMEIGQQEEAGSITTMQGSHGFRIGDERTDAPHIQWRLDKEMAGGGALVDVGIYVIQAGRYVTGEEPSAVTAQEYTTRPDVFDEVDETIFFQLEFPSGAVLDGSTTYNGYLNRFQAAAESGWLELRPAFSYEGLNGASHEGNMDLPNVNQQARQMDAFAECILEDKTSRVSGEEGLRDMQVIESIYESIAAGGDRVEIG